MKNSSKQMIATLFSFKHGGIKAPDPSPEHEATETPEQEKLEHETGIEANDEDDIGPSAAADHLQRLSSHLSAQAHPTPMDGSKPVPKKGLNLDGYDAGMTDHSKAARLHRTLAAHFEKKARSKK